MKKNITRLLYLFLSLLMVFNFAACGGGSKEAEDSDHIVIGDYELQYKSACIMEDVDGKDALVLTLDFTNNSKESADYMWSVYEKAMQDGMELESATVYIDRESFDLVSDSQSIDINSGKTIEIRTAFTLRDADNAVTVTFSDLFDEYTGTVTIDPSKVSRAAVSGSDDVAAPAETGDALLDWWNGDWYGWWKVASGDGDYEEWQGKWWDCCANISIGADYTGNVIIWDEDLPKDDALSAAAVGLSSAGTGEYGTLTSESGYFLDGELSHADWIVDPGLMDYDSLICIDGWYEDDSGSFKYEIYLRPWGTLWDDVAADAPDDLPYGYYDWYLPLVEAGEAMPEKISTSGDGMTP